MPRKTKKIPQTISLKEFNLILSQLFKSKRKLSRYEKFTRIRNLMIFYSAFYLGLRPKEAKDIKIDDLNFDNQTLFIPAQNNKQRNQDILPIPDFIFDKVIGYLKIKNQFFKNSPWLFPNRHGQLERGTLIRAWKTLLKKAGLLKLSYIDSQGKPRYNLTLYSLRHSFGSYAYEKLHDIRKIANLLRQYDEQCRSALVYIHTTQNKARRQIFNELYS